MSNYEGLSGAQLKAELKLRGLPHSGVLKTMRERLMADDAAKEQAAKEQAAKEAEKQALADDGEELEEVEDDEDDEDDNATESANTSEGEGKLNNSDDEDEIAAAVAVEVKKEVKEKQVDLLQSPQSAPPAGTPISRKRTSEGKQEISSKRQKSAGEDSNAFASQMVAMAAQRAGGQSTPSKAMTKKRNDLSSLHITTPASVGGTEKKPADDDDDNDSYCDEHDLAITELGLDNTFTFAEVKNAVRGKGLPTPQYRDFMLRIDRARLASEEVKTPASEESSKSLRAALAKGTASMVAAKLKDICKPLTTKIKPEGWQAIDKVYLYTSSGVTPMEDARARARRADRPTATQDQPPAFPASGLKQSYPSLKKVLRLQTKKQAKAFFDQLITSCPEYTSMRIFMRQKHAKIYNPHATSIIPISKGSERLVHDAQPNWAKIEKSHIVARLILTIRRLINSQQRTDAGVPQEADNAIPTDVAYITDAQMDGLAWDIYTFFSKEFTGGRRYDPLHLVRNFSHHLALCTAETFAQRHPRLNVAKLLQVSASDRSPDPVVAGFLVGTSPDRGLHTQTMPLVADTTLAEINAWGHQVFKVEIGLTYHIRRWDDGEFDRIKVQTEPTWRRIRDAALKDKHDLAIMFDYNIEVPDAISALHTSMNLPTQGLLQDEHDTARTQRMVKVLRAILNDPRRTSPVITTSSRDGKSLMAVRDLVMARTRDAQDEQGQAVEDATDPRELNHRDITISCDAVAEVLASKKDLRWSNVGLMKAQLRQALVLDGDNPDFPVVHEDLYILERLPPVRGPDGREVPGEPHLPHQITYLGWAVTMDLKMGVHFNFDEMGLGKTHDIMAFIVAADAVASRARGDWPDVDWDRPTLVVVPASMLEDSLRNYQAKLGRVRKIYCFGGRAKQPHNGFQEKNLFLNDTANEFFTGDNAHYHVGFATYELFSNLAKGTSLKGLFFRTIYDEAQNLRYAEHRRAGQVAISTDAVSKAFFTGTPIVESLLDYRGLLAVNAGPTPIDKVTDFNKTSTAEAPHSVALPHYAAVEDFVAGLTGDHPPPRPAHADPHDFVHGTVAPGRLEGWKQRCPHMDDRLGGDAEAVKQFIADGYECEHFPANVIWNPFIMKHRSPSCHSWERLGATPGTEKVARVHERAVADADPGLLHDTAYNHGTGQRGRSLRRDDIKPPYEPRPMLTCAPSADPRLNFNATKRMMTPLNFNYEVYAHITKNLTGRGNLQLASKRLNKLMRGSACGRTYASKITLEDGTEQSIGHAIPEMVVSRTSIFPLPAEADRAEFLMGQVPLPTDFNFGDYYNSRNDEAQPAEFLYETDRGRSAAASPIVRKPGSRWWHELEWNSHMGLYALRNIPRDIFCGKWKNTSFAWMVYLMWQNAGLDPAQYNVSPFTSEEAMLQAFCWGAPMYAYLGVRVWETIQNKGEDHNKSICLFHSSKSATAAEKMLSHMGIKCTRIDSSDKHHERDRKIQAFNTDASIKVLIYPMSLKLVGHSFQGVCCTVFVCERTYNFATELQAVCRIRRLFQFHEQEVERLYLPWTKHAGMETRMQQKYLQSVYAMSTLSSDEDLSNKDRLDLARAVVRAMFGCDTLEVAGTAGNGASGDLGIGGLGGGDRADLGIGALGGDADDLGIGALGGDADDLGIGALGGDADDLGIGALDADDLGIGALGGDADDLGIGALGGDADDLGIGALGDDADDLGIGALGGDADDLGIGALGGDADDLGIGAL
ncbi:putative P-loop containing nucleoside triphosphate hydrolase, SAP domain superfamily [Septoria linicola]|nr:putative P-loop containing nucleoside triphosphate hydrolase, SAP domain superfamily [Septoria linicola]